MQKIKKKKLKKATKGCRGSKTIAEDHKSQMSTEGCRRSQRFSEGCRNLKNVTEVCRISKTIAEGENVIKVEMQEVTGGHRSLKKVT